MTIFLIALAVTLLAMAAMGVGLIADGRPLRGGCHGSALGCALGGICRRGHCDGGDHADG